MIVSELLRADPYLDADVDAPFSPHIGVHLRMHCAPAAVLAFRPVQAPALPAAKVTGSLWVQAVARLDNGRHPEELRPQTAAADDEHAANPCHAGPSGGSVRPCGDASASGKNVGDEVALPGTNFIENGVFGNTFADEVVDNEPGDQGPAGQPEDQHGTIQWGQGVKDDIDIAAGVDAVARLTRAWKRWATIMVHSVLDAAGSTLQRSAFRPIGAPPRYKLVHAFGRAPQPGEVVNGSRFLRLAWAMAHAAARCQRPRARTFWAKQLRELADSPRWNHPRAAPSDLATVAADTRSAAITITDAAGQGLETDAQLVAANRAGAEAGDAEFRKAAAKRMYAKAVISGEGDTKYLHAVTRWAAKPPPPPPLPPKGTADGPQPAADAISLQWARKWDSTPQRRDEAIRAVCSLASRARAMASDAAETFKLEWTPAKLRARALAFPARTSIGLDGVAFRAVAAMPDMALTELIFIMTECIRSLAVPLQSLTNSVITLGKAKWGTPD